jgi:hypothetical protein
MTWERWRPAGKLFRFEAALADGMLALQAEQNSPANGRRNLKGSSAVDAQFLHPLRKISHGENMY